MHIFIQFEAKDFKWHIGEKFNLHMLHSDCEIWHGFQEHEGKNKNGIAFSHISIPSSWTKFSFSEEK